MTFPSTIQKFLQDCPTGPVCPSFEGGSLWRNYETRALVLPGCSTHELKNPDGTIFGLTTI